MERSGYYAPYLGAAAALLAAGGGVLALALARYPFDGFYGQDSYAYYYQALEIGHQLLGQPPPPWPFAGLGLFHWPVGYHLHLLLGLLAGESPAGGRALTLALAAGAPVLVYALTIGLWGAAAGRRARIVAGLVAGGVLLITGIYLRLGLAVMSDVPALAWAVLGVGGWVWGVRGWGAATGRPARRNSGWLAAGFALGGAVLIRYDEILLLVPLAIYTLLTWRRTPSQNPKSKIQNLLWAVAGGALALVPQALYLASYPHAHLDPGALTEWTPAHFFQTTVQSVDGPATFAHPMVMFFGLDPVRDTAVGFLSPFYGPAWLLGLATLLRRRDWPLLGLLGSWWATWVLFLSGLPYQAHRFVLGFLPVLVILIGIGAAQALEAILGPAIALRTGAGRGPAGFRPGLGAWRVGATAIAGLVLLSVAVGGVQSIRGAQEQVAAQVGIKSAELAAVRVVQQATAGQPGTPRIVAFGLSAALYHYTQWPVLDFFDYGIPEIGRFLAPPGPRLIVVPEGSLATQWQGTPSAGRWDWMRTHYPLQLAGHADPYTVYRVTPAP